MYMYKTFSGHINYPVIVLWTQYSLEKIVHLRIYYLKYFFIFNKNQFKKNNI